LNVSPRPPTDFCVRSGPSSPPPKGDGAANFWPGHICCGQMSGWIKMPRGREVGLNPSDIVLDGNPAPLLQKGHPQFSAYICCGQMAGWIKMPRGTEVDLSVSAFERLAASPPDRFLSRSGINRRIDDSPATRRSAAAAAAALWSAARRGSVKWRDRLARHRPPALSDDAEFDATSRLDRRRT